MFYLLEYRDIIIILRGLLILIVVIMLGVAVAEQQVSSLTQRHDGVQVFNISRDKSVYSIHLLGSNYNISAVYPVGEIINNDKSIVIKTAHYQLIIPTYIEMDCRKELAWLDSRARALVDAGFKYKQALYSYLYELQKEIAVYIRQFR